MMRIVYLAALADTIGTDAETFTEPLTETHNTVAELKAALTARGGAWGALNDASVQVAVNHTIAQPDTLIPEGAEVAFFPPVTGG